MTKRSLDDAIKLWEYLHKSKSTMITLLEFLKYQDSKLDVYIGETRGVDKYDIAMQQRSIQEINRALVLLIRNIQWERGEK